MRSIGCFWCFLASGDADDAADAADVVADLADLADLAGITTSVITRCQNGGNTYLRCYDGRRYSLSARMALTNG